jgi:osmotically-inducible protein OsmY
MKLKLTLIAATAAVSMVAACGGSSNSNYNTNHSNGITNLGTNTANSNMYVTNSNVNSSNANNASKWNSNISKEEYEKNRTEYEKNKSSSESFGQSLEDSWLWFKTKSALATTSDLRDSTINVDVANGVITLKGTVTNAAEKAKAKQVADGIEGKKSVVDQLKVAPNDSMTNTKSGNTKSNSNVKK